MEWARQHRDFIGMNLAEDDGTVQEYLGGMVKLGTWGDHLMLQVLCNVYQVKVVVIKKMHDGRIVWNLVGDMKEGDTFIPLWLAGEHYENMVSARDIYG